MPSKSSKEDRPVVHTLSSVGDPRLKEAREFLYNQEQQIDIGLRSRIITVIEGYIQSRLASGLHDLATLGIRDRQLHIYNGPRHGFNFPGNWGTSNGVTRHALHDLLEQPIFKESFLIKDRRGVYQNWLSYETPHPEEFPTREEVDHFLDVLLNKKEMQSVHPWFWYSEEGPAHHPIHRSIRNVSDQRALVSILEIQNVFLLAQSFLYEYPSLRGFLFQRDPMFQKQIKVICQWDPAHPQMEQVSSERILKVRDAVQMAVHRSRDFYSIDWIEDNRFLTLENMVERWQSSHPFHQDIKVCHMKTHNVAGEVVDPFVEVLQNQEAALLERHLPPEIAPAILRRI